MTKNQIKIIEDSWGKVLAYNNQLGDIFYYELFAKAPELKSLFKEDAKLRSRKLLFAVVSLATKVHKLENIEEDVKAMAKRHIKYGVKPEYFKIFGKCFIIGLEQILKDDWNKNLKSAWEGLFMTVSEAMIKTMKKILQEQSITQSY